MNDKSFLILIQSILKAYRWTNGGREAVSKIKYRHKFAPLYILVPNFLLTVIFLLKDAFLTEMISGQKDDKRTTRTFLS
ncbi:hypothetical protein [Candidatus Odyssella thessalonicensis]|uniref:hypothetical protein n=1 Tax=Candidatus Odyssella thessalonicensis TaxID=84647 RepID=UPI000225ACD2|nr:hypothetical protein [Candidatus Odyssella thessalonicensis]